MKRIILLILTLVTTNLTCEFNGALTAGYLFKHDSNFKAVYGKGLPNLITADGCYAFKEHWGAGAKVSYLRAHGETSFLQAETLLQQVPVTFYLRRIENYDTGLQLYGSLGGGFSWIKEKSYLGNVGIYKGLGEAEIGLSYPMYRTCHFTTAFRYLFPHESHCGNQIDVGGFDFRAGLGFSW